MTALVMNGWTWVIILLVVLLLFGAPKLPVLAKSLGQSLRIFQKEMKAMGDDDPKATSDSAKGDSESKDSSPDAR